MNLAIVVIWCCNPHILKHHNFFGGKMCGTGSSSVLARILWIRSVNTLNVHVVCYNLNLEINLWIWRNVVYVGRFKVEGIACWFDETEFAPVLLNWINVKTFWLKKRRNMSQDVFRIKRCINLVDSARSHMLVSKIKPCMSKYKQLYSETANGSLYQF